MPATGRFLVVLGLLTSVFAAPLWAEKVRYVVDGDTFILENNQHVRMIGIDAPEVEHRRHGKKGEPFGKESRRYLRSLIEGEEIELAGGPEPFDRFGRRLAYVYLVDGTFVNRQMVADGFAEVMRKFPFEHKAEFFSLEREAREAKRGLWAEKPASWASALAGFFHRVSRGP